MRRRLAFLMDVGNSFTMHLICCVLAAQIVAKYGDSLIRRGSCELLTRHLRRLVAPLEGMQREEFLPPRKLNFSAYLASRDEPIFGYKSGSKPLQLASLCLMRMCHPHQFSAVRVVSKT